MVHMIRKTKYKQLVNDWLLIFHNKLLNVTYRISLSSKPGATILFIVFEWGGYYLRMDINKKEDTYNICQGRNTKATQFTQSTSYIY